jgi:hypothetical protein
MGGVVLQWDYLWGPVLGPHVSTPPARHVHSHGETWFHVAPALDITLNMGDITLSIT